MYEQAGAMALRFLPEAGHVEPYGGGHINDTYRVTLPDGARYVLQRLNTAIFTRPEQVMENIAAVTAHLKAVILREGGDAQRGTLTFLSARDGSLLERDGEGGVWRMMRFIEGACSVDLPDTPALFELSGRAFGRFQRQMDGFDAARLHETIPGFHDTPARFAQLEAAASRDAMGRAAGCAAELAFCRAREKEAGRLLEALSRGEIPLRVTHNDTKLNNVLLDEKTGEGVCVIDLDTVMPGLTAYDFGDAIRTGASTAAEDEPDLSKVGFSMTMFEAFARGYLGEAGAMLTAQEIASLPLGAWTMTFECGMRFLADHLSGDTYFKIARPGHNLDRARTQFALCAQMEARMEEMACAVAKQSG